MKFAEEVLGVLTLTDDQKKVLLSIARHKRTSVKSGHGVGKTMVMGIACLYFISVYDPAVVLTTAPTERQVKQLLWREIRHRHRMAVIPLDGKPLIMQMEISPIRYMLGLSTKDADQLQGFHNPNIFVVIDEANGYPIELYEPIESLLSGGEVIRYAQIGNPILPAGPFFDSFSDGDTNTITISCLDHPNIVHKKNLIPGAVTWEWVERQRKLWGEDSAFWYARILGQFPRYAEDLVVNLAWAEAAEQEPIRHKIETKDLYLGLDVPEYGNDLASWYIGTKWAKKHTYRVQNKEPAEIIGITKQLIKRFQVPQSHVSVDGIGVGATVFSVLKETYPKINRFVASQTAKDDKTFENKGTEAWWNIRNLLNFDGDDYENYSFNGKVDRLKSDLCTRKYRTSSHGRIMLEPKIEYRKRMKRSPDDGDGMAICYSPLVSTKSYGYVILPDVMPR